MPEAARTMSYAEQKRRNDKAMKDRMAKMEEQQHKQELETQRRKKLRDARERKLAKEKAKKDALEAERVKKALEDAAQVKLPSGKAAAPTVDDTHNLYLYAGTRMKIPWDTAPKALVSTIGDLLKALNFHFDCDAVERTCGIYVDTEPMDTWNVKGPLAPEKRLQELFFEWRAGNPGESLRQAVERKDHLEHTIEANNVMILERGDGLIEMQAYASEAEISMEKGAIAKLQKMVVKAKAEILQLEKNMVVMEKELLKIARKPAKRLRLICRQVHGAPVNNPKITNLLYTQAYAFATTGHYVIDWHTVPVLGAIHLQVTHGDDDKDVMYQRSQDRRIPRLEEEVGMWAMARISHPRANETKIIAISDAELEMSHAGDGNPAYRHPPSEHGLRFGHYCPSHAVAQWVRVFGVAWTPLRQYQQTRARRHFLDLLERKCENKYPHYGLNVWPVIMLPEPTEEQQQAMAANRAWVNTSDTEEEFEDITEGITIEQMQRVLKYCVRIQAVARGIKTRRELARKNAAHTPKLAVAGVDGATLVHLSLDQGGLALHDPITLRRLDFPGAGESGSGRQTARLQEISPLPSATYCGGILDADDEIMGYTLQLTMLSEFAGGRCLRCETSAGHDIISLLHSLLEARGKQSNPNSHVSNWEEEHQVHAEPRPFSELLSRRTYRLANFKNSDWHDGTEKYATPMKSAALRKLAAMERMENGLGDGVRPKVPYEADWSDSDEETPKAGPQAAGRGSQTPTLPPIARAAMG